MKRSLIAVLFIAAVWLSIIGLSLPLSAQALDRADGFETNITVVAMMAQVQSSQVYSYEAQLSGEVPALIGGVPYTITTRNTGSGIPIQQATQFAYEHLQRQGLAASYLNWTNCGRSNRNVVGVLTGTVTPNEIVLITAHLDNMPPTGRAPGADDNASGSVGVMLAAEIMSRYRFERTLRFVFFTGEEQGLCGSEVYAANAAAAGDDVVAVYNMDMIAYDALDGPTLRLHTRTTGNSGYAADLAIASVFTQVVNSYGLSGTLIPIIDPDGTTLSDQSSFWDVGYPAILAIEDDVNDFNAYYHTSNDNLSHINLTYLTNFVKASVGTAAHLARPVVNFGYLRGTVVETGTLQPLLLAQISAVADVTRTGNTDVDSSGQYTLPLLTGSYTVAANAYGYTPVTITGVAITEGITVTQDFTLSPADIYSVTGQVRDVRTGQALSATITIGGYPYAPITTDGNGHYEVSLAAEQIYQFRVQANVPGYAMLERTVGPLNANRVEDFALDADLIACTAPGYTLVGLNQTFDTTGVPTGWHVINNVGSSGWRFDDPKPRGNLTGGSGNFAIADSDYAGSGVSMNTDLRSPAMNLTALDAVTLTFKTDFRYYTAGGSEVADVDISTNGASGPWSNVWRKSADYRGPRTETISLTAYAAGRPNVMVRFHYYNAVFDWWWQIDEVRLGQCFVPSSALPIVAPQTLTQQGETSAVLEYGLQVTNTDVISHVYDVVLTGYAHAMSATTPVGPVPPHSAAPLTVTIVNPPYALGNATSVVSATVRTHDNPLLSATAVLTAIVTPQWRVGLFPTLQTRAGMTGTTVIYNLDVTNLGNVSDVYHLTLDGNQWLTSLSVTQTLVTVTPRFGGFVGITAFVAIPFTATPGMTDTVRITATGTGTTAFADLITIVAAYQVHLPIITK